MQLPRGFRMAGVYCGIKRNPHKLDLSLIVSDVPAVAAGVYTQNRVFSATVGYNRARTPSGAIRAIAINSGNSNACTGERGERDAAEMARLAGAACGVSEHEVLVLSTGLIGEFLPMDKIASGIRTAAERLNVTHEGLLSAARGMLTTDTHEKIAGRNVIVDGTSISILGMAKGAAMIGPNMATMLAVILTDAALAVDDAQALLSAVVDDSFNCISVDGHMSTNDTVLFLANGTQSRRALAGGDLKTFHAALAEVATELARAIPADGEGATHLVTIDVAGCATRQDAYRIAKVVAESPLVKTAIAGGDPNWGRIVSAAGYAGIAFDPVGVSLDLNGTRLYERGSPVAFDAAAVSASIRQERETHIRLQFAEGSASVRFWTTDLTAEYVRLNADYHT